MGDKRRDKKRRRLNRKDTLDWEGSITDVQPHTHKVLNKYKTNHIHRQIASNSRENRPPR